MTLSERIASREPAKVCYYCRLPYSGRYDSHARSHNLPAWVRRALRGELPAKVTR